MQALHDYQQQQRDGRRDAKRQFADEIKYSAKGTAAKRKDGTTAYFGVYELEGASKGRWVKCRKTAEKGGRAIPDSWKKLSNSGKRQKRTDTGSAEALKSIRVYLSCESRLASWWQRRASAVCDHVLDEVSGLTQRPTRPQRC